MSNARIALVLLAGVVCLGRVHAQNLSSQAHKVQVETCEDVSNFEDCHDNYPTGCSNSQNPNYDAYLNFVKNQLPTGSPDSDSVLEAGDFSEFEDKLPAGLGTRNHAHYAQELETLGEGQIRMVEGYLYYVVDTGKKSGTGESSNCQLVGDGNADFHIGIGFDASVAQQLGGHGHPAMKDLEQNSVIVEMTPHYRAQFHPKWTFAQVQKALGRPVLVIGQLMADNEHSKAKDDCGNPHSNTSTCWRASIWELHPVMEFYVCTGTHACDAGDLTTWTKLDDLP